MSAVKFCKADVLILGGDLTSKMLVPIVDFGNGTFKADYLGGRIVRGAEEVKALEREISANGYFCYHCGQTEMDDRKASREKVDKLFMATMKETLLKWAAALNLPSLIWA